MTYKNFLIFVKERPRLTLLLKTVDILAVSFTVCAYTAVLVSEATDNILFAFKLLLVSATPFVIVSLLRRIIDAPRPYEFYDIYDTPPRRREGRSFPSRHAFSIFAIGTSTAFVCPALAAVILLLGVALSASRVLLGIHFPRDVIAGAVIGTVTSVIGMIIMI